VLTVVRFTVSSSGTFFATVPARGAIAIRVGQTIKPAAVPVTFASTVSTVYGENVFVSGSIPQLGSWDAGSSVSVILCLYAGLGH
jgi:alpha-amylase